MSQSSKSPPNHRDMAERVIRVGQLLAQVEQSDPTKSGVEGSGTISKQNSQPTRPASGKRQR